MILRAAGIGPGHEVITVSHTFVATAAAIHHVGATPVLVDIGEDHNMNVDCVEQAISPCTKAVLPLHLNGRVCDMGQLMTIAEKHGLLVIEDAAQALGGAFNGTRGGAFGLAGCFSFYPAKLLGAYGDAGAVVTNSREITEKVALLRNHGRTTDGDIAGWSFNCRLDNLQAALLTLKLKKLPEWIARRRKLAELYHQRLSDLRQLHLPSPPTDDGPYYDVFQNYEIEVQDRDRLVTYLKDKGIETLISWGGKGVHQFTALGLSHFNLLRTERLFRQVLMLPLHTELSNEQVETVQVLQLARCHYGGNIPLLRLDAHALLFPARSFDMVILYEAIYYLSRPEQFLEECRCILRDGGVLLICAVNKEWADFNPSPFSTRYFSAKELSDLFTEAPVSGRALRCVPGGKGVYQGCRGAIH